MFLNPTINHIDLRENGVFPAFSKPNSRIDISQPTIPASQGNMDGLFIP
jgi:hypothetical protein